MTLNEVTKLHLYLLYCVIASLVCYIGCLIFLNDYLHVASLTITDFCLIFVIFTASFGPIFIWKYFHYNIESSVKYVGRLKCR